MTKWRCVLCGEYLARVHLHPAIDHRARKWISALHKICFDIYVADALAELDVSPNVRAYKARRKDNHTGQLASIQRERFRLSAQRILNP